jgi:hypothetical protein
MLDDAVGMQGVDAGCAGDHCPAGTPRHPRLGFERRSAQAGDKVKTRAAPRLSHKKLPRSI